MPSRSLQIEQVENKQDIGVMSRDGIDEVNQRNTLGVHRSEEVEQRMEGCEQLLPGFPDDITLNVIAPKLPWTTFHLLSSVSRSWQRAIQSHEVYKARVRSKCTEPLIVFCGHSIGLFSIRKGSSRLLPPISDFWPDSVTSDWSRKRVFLDGKLYVLGGGVYGASTEVYVLDLAGQRQWKQCASMTTARSRFGCGVKDGKIYAFGGAGHRDTVYESEVYDPKKDAWSPISRSVHLGYMHQKVTTVGDELFVHSGQLGGSRSPFHYRNEYMSYAAVYHPLKDKWRIVENFNGNSGENALTTATVLTMRGKLHKLTRFGVQVFDIKTSSWNAMQPFSIGEPLRPNHPFEIKPVAAAAVDDEILALVDTYGDSGWQKRTLFIRNQGVGGENGEVLWQTLPSSSHIDDDDLSCLIEL